MAISSYLNKRQQSGNAALWWLIKAMRDAGWTVAGNGSGTGGLYHASTFLFDDWAERADCAVGVGVGSEDWGHENCWIVLENPAGTRQVLIHASSSASATYEAYWGLFYSPGALYTGGDATTAATATDEVTIFGNHTTGVALFSGGGESNVCHAAADSAPSAAGEYGFILVNFVSPCATDGYFFCDDLRQTATGDTAAAVYGAKAAGMDDSSMSSRNWKAIVDDGGVGEAWEDIAYAWPYCNSQFYGDVPGGASRYDGKERPLPVFALDPDVGGYLGASRWFRAAAITGIRHYSTQESATVFTVDDTAIVDLWDGTSEPATI